MEVSILSQDSLDDHNCQIGEEPTEVQTGNPDPEEPSKKFEYLIDEMLPDGRVSLVAGPSGAGKTTFVLQLARNWLEGEPILGMPTRRPLVHVKANCEAHKRRACSQSDHYAAGTFLHIAADRGQADTEETMDRVLGADSPLLTDKTYGFKWMSILGGEYTITNFLNMVQSERAVKWLFIEGVATLIDGKLSDNSAVAGFLKQVSQFAQDQKITILLSVHSPKMKKGEEYNNPRERILGAVAWGGYSSTLFVLSQDDPSDMKNLNRTLIVLPRNHPTREYHFTMTKEGRLHETFAQETLQARLSLRQILKIDTWMSRGDLLAIFTNLGLSPSALDRSLAAFLESGVVAKRRHPENYREKQYKLIEEPLFGPDPVLGEVPRNGDN
jgi:AAA domain